MAVEHGIAMAQTRFDDFQDFWPFYVLEHSKPATRLSHFVGTTAAAFFVVMGIATGLYWLVPLGLVAGYGSAWVSHFFIEHNKPASFKQPVYSFLADWKMWAYMIAGRMGAEVERARAHQRDAHEEVSEPA
jgi:hypothetical protein